MNATTEALLPHCPEAECGVLGCCLIDTAKTNAVAFARIRDQSLYRCKFRNFEEYCRQKWQYGRYVDRLISAAQVFTHLMTFCHQNQSARLRFDRW